MAQRSSLVVTSNFILFLINIIMATGQVLTYIFTLGIFLVSLTIHEYAHAWVAYKYGDDTAARMGRLTLNPPLLTPYFPGPGNPLTRTSSPLSYSPCSPLGR